MQLSFSPIYWEKKLIQRTEEGHFHVGSVWKHILILVTDFFYCLYHKGKRVEHNFRLKEVKEEKKKKLGIREKTKKVLDIREIQLLSEQKYGAVV